MAPSQGFACNATAVAGITASYNAAQGIALSGSVAIDEFAKALPAGGYWSHIEARFTQTAAATASVTFFLSWDAAGDQMASGEATFTLVPGVTTAASLGAAVGLDVWTSWNDNRVTGTVYLWCKTNAGTVRLDQARLYWRDHHAG